MDAEQLRSHEFGRILIIKLSALGDVIHTIPVLHKLRRRYPDTRIDWLTSPAIGGTSYAAGPARRSRIMYVSSTARPFQQRARGSTPQTRNP